MKYSLIILFLFFSLFKLSAQVKYESEHRILKSNFPIEGLELIKEKLVHTKRIKYYKEIDSAITNYKAKFKKDRLWYTINFNEDGNFKNVALQIKNIDIPNESFENILGYLDKNHSLYKIKKMYQQYDHNSNIDTTFKNAFQNLMIPSLNYEIEVETKKEKLEFIILFDAGGIFQNSRKSLPKNYDHVLY
jgi:hypothetical protein